MPRLTLAILAPLSFGTISSASATAVAGCLPFDFLHEVSIGVGEVGKSFG